MPSKSNTPKDGHNPNAYLRYSGMVMQLFVLLFLAAFLGQKIDAKLGNETLYATALLILGAVIAYLIKVYFDLTKNP